MERVPPPTCGTHGTPTCGIPTCGTHSTSTCATTHLWHTQHTHLWHTRHVAWLHRRDQAHDGAFLLGLTTDPHARLKRRSSRGVCPARGRRLRIQGPPCHEGVLCVLRKLRLDWRQELRVHKGVGGVCA